MQNTEKKPYLRPVSHCTVVGLESPICTGSIKVDVDSPYGGEGNQVEAHQINQGFSSANDFSGKTGTDAWD